MPAPKKNPVSSIAKQVVKKARKTKTARALQNKASKEFGLERGTSAGLRKAPAKVQKGLDATENRIPGKPKMVTGISNGKVYADTKNSSVRVRGSNRKAVKGETPKRTPGVKKNKSLQRSINNSNRQLKGPAKIKSVKKSSMPIKKKK